jgi:hypothetical protein
MDMHIWAKQPRDGETIMHGGARTEAGLYVARIEYIAG